MTPTDCMRNMAHVTAIQAILERGATSAQVDAAEALLRAYGAPAQYELSAWGVA